MVNDFKIKKYWIITLCMMFCSFVSFAQKLSDKEIGFDADKVISSSKAQGLTSELITKKVTSMRDLYTSKYITMQKSKMEFLKEIKLRNTPKTITKTNTRSTAKTAVDPDISQTERQGLLALYNSTAGENWNNNTGWTKLSNSNIKVTELYGVTIENGKVIKIQLYDNHLNGTLPADIGLLTNLQEINLSTNNIYGALPSEIGQLKNLETLGISQTNLSGTIPKEIGQLTNIKDISLVNNALTGTIPAEIGLLQNLLYFSLYGNQMSGPLPSQIGQLSNLVYLDLTGSQLGGTIPTELQSLTNLEGLLLAGTGLSGTLDVLKPLKKLVRLEIGSNQLTGTIPPEFGQFSNLDDLDLSGNLLTGSIPIELFSLPRLRGLGLAGNKLTGSIPHQIGQLKNLNYLYLSGNLLNGSIPAQIGLLSNLQAIYLNDNNLSGSLPTEMSSLRYIRSVNLSNNKLEGIVPNLTTSIDLFALDISYNKFRYIDFVAQYPVYKKYWQFYYAPQGVTDEEKTINTFIGNSVTLEMFTDGRFTNNEEYVWCKLANNGINYALPVPGATSRKLTIPAVQSGDIGTYYCIARNPQMTEYGNYNKYLELFTDLIHVKISPCNPIIAGTIKTSIPNPEPNQPINFSFETANTGITFKWTFYDLDNVTEIATSTSAQVSRSYNTLGKYKIKLVITDLEGCNETFEKSIAITKICPPVVGTLKTNSEEPVLNSEVKFSFDTAATGLSYYWTFYDSNNITVKDIQKTPVATQSYTTSGTYKINLAVTNETTGCSTSYDKTIIFRPDCTFSWNRDGEIYSPNDIYGNKEGILINTVSTFTFGRYRAPIQGLTYEWKLYDANGVVMQSGNTINFTVTVTKLENYKITLSVSDYNGCTSYEKTLIAKDPNDCIIPSKDRFNDQVSIQLNDYRGAAVGVETTMGIGYVNGYTESNFTFIWKAYNANGVLIGSGNQPRFLITFPSIEEYRIELELKDNAGCKTYYTKLITPLTYCEFSNDDRYGEISHSEVNLNETNDITFYPYYSSENFTYHWEVVNSKGVSIISSDLDTFPLTLSVGGNYEIHLTVKDIVNGCEREIIQDLQCIIDNSCTNTNPKSEKVKALYEDLLVNLISRSIQGETDAQINASAPTAEFLALKSYITNGSKDKIYNYVSTSRNGTELNGREKIFGARFSFSPDREYDVDAIIGWGVGYDPKKTTLAQLKAIVKDSVYTDLSQYITSEEFITSCKTRYSGGGKMSKMMNRSSLDYCSFGSQIRHIDFCPGEVNTCDPAIIGSIITPGQSVFTNENAKFTFDTFNTNLTYTWSATTEDGEVLNTTEPGIDVKTYTYKFKYEGGYIVTAVLKDQSGCTATFRRYIAARDTHCANAPYGFKFETDATNLNYTWTAKDTNGNIVSTATNTTGLFTFTPTLPGNYNIEVTTDSGEICETVFSKYVEIISCQGSVSCTQDNPLTSRVHTLFINLINKLVSTPNGTDVNVYAQSEIAAFVPYTLGKGGKIYKFVNTNTYISFSFSDDTFKSDVTLPKSATGTITSVDLSRFYNAQAITPVTTNYSDGTYNITSGDVENINFCPSQECTPLVGTITIVKRTANATKPASTVLPTKTYKYEGIWLSNATQQPEVNAWVDYKDASGVQKRTVIGAVTNGCKEIIASSIVSTNGVDVCSDCKELHVESQNTELCYNVTYLDCSGQIKTLVTDATTVFPGKRIISAVQQACNSTSPPPVETSKTTTSTSSRI